MIWPVLAGDDERWAVRAAIDAVVADAYGLSRDQYARFDELKQIGLDAFTRNYDPYHDIPLNENLPQPVIDLPIPTAEGERQVADGGVGEFRLRAESRARGGRRRRS
jgi:hypothetical protein